MQFLESILIVNLNVQRLLMLHTKLFMITQSIRKVHHTCHSDYTNRASFQVTLPCCEAMKNASYSQPFFAGVMEDALHCML